MMTKPGVLLLKRELCAGPELKILNNEIEIHLQSSEAMVRIFFFCYRFQIRHLKPKVSSKQLLCSFGEEKNPK